MIAGATYTLPIDIQYPLGNVSKVIVTLKNETTQQKILKNYPNDNETYLMSDGRLGVRLSQQDTLDLVGNVKVEAQINLASGAVAKTETKRVFVSPTLHTEMVEGATDNGEVYLEDVVLEIDAPITENANGGGGGFSVDKTMTVEGAAADAKAVGDLFAAQQKQIDSKQPVGDYALKSEIPSMPDVPVKSVNGKTGAVQLSASDVGARPSIWTPSAEDVGADARGTADKKVSEHNTSDASHNDIRMLVTGLTTRLNSLANSTDTDLDQLAEIVAYIKANKSLIDSITTSKVNVADIIDNLTTSVSNKPLSAKMGVELKKLIDAIKIPTTLPASDVYDWAKQPQKPSYNKTEVGLGNVNNERQYSANNPPPYPVASVNGKTGAVQLGAADVGAASVEKVAELSEAIDDLQKKIDDEDYVLTEVDIINIAQKAADMINDPIGGGLDVELTEEETAELESTISDLKSLKTANTSVIAFLTDLHIGTGTPTKIKKAVYGYNSIADSVKTDLLLYGGDYMDNNPTTTKAQALSMFTNLRSVLSLADDTCPAAVIKGNHDDNTLYTDYINGLVNEESFWSALGNIDDDRTVRNAGCIEDCYGYYDIPNQKIRVFYVNTVDLPQTLNEVTNTVNYKGQWDTGISVKQLQFIADHLKFYTAGWRVIVFSHHPIMHDITIENGCGVQADRGGAALLDLLDKFNQTKKAGSITVTGTGFTGTVSYDFSKNDDCKMIACVNGHTHRDNVEIFNESYFCISTRAVYGHPSYDGHISSSAYFVVDRNNDKLHLLYNGDGEENVFDYGSLNTGETQPDEPTIEEITSPFEWQIGILNDTTGALESDSQSMRISTIKPVGFTTAATIDMSANGNDWYVPYWYDTDGNYIECEGGWISVYVPLEVPVGKMIGIKVGHNSYGIWDDAGINTFAENIIVTVEAGGEAYDVPDVPDQPDEPEEPTIELGKPLENVIYAIGVSASDGSAGMDVYGNAQRMTALVTYGNKPVSDINNKVGEEAYFIAIPAEATKMTVTCPNFIYGFQFLKYENDAYTKLSDPGWQTLGGGSSAFEAGTYSHVAINYKNSSNTNIPADTDTSGFSIQFD